MGSFPKDYKNNKDKHMDLVILKCYQKLHQKSTDYVDIFCEKGYFTVEDTIRLLELLKHMNYKQKHM